MLYIHVACSNSCPHCMSMSRAAFSRYMSMLHVQAACSCHTSTLHVDATVNAACLRCMFMVHAHDAYHALRSSSTYIQCSMSIRVEWFFTFKVNQVFGFGKIAETSLKKTFFYGLNVFFILNQLFCHKHNLINGHSER